MMIGTQRSSDCQRARGVDSVKSRRPRMSSPATMIIITGFFDVEALDDVGDDRDPEQGDRRDDPFRMLGTILEANPYLGRVVTGRIFAGAVKPNQPVKVLDRNGNLIEEGRITKVLAFRGLERVPIEEGTAGDIVAIAGLPDAFVSHTLCAPEVTEPLPAQPIDPPTLTMTFRINDSPLAQHPRATRSEPRHPRPYAARGRRQRGAADFRNPPKSIPWKSPAAANCSSAFSSRPCGAKALSFRCHGPKCCSSTIRPASCSNRSRKC